MVILAWYDNDAACRENMMIHILMAGKIMFSGIIWEFLAN